MGEVTMTMMAASLLGVGVVVERAALEGRPMIRGSKTHLRKTITITIDMVGGVKRVVLPLTMAIVDGVEEVVLAIITMAMTMTMTMRMAMTTTMAMTIDVVGGMEGVVLDGRCMAGRTGLDRLARTSRGQTHVLMASHRPGCCLVQPEDDHIAPTTRGLSALMAPDLGKGSAETRADPPAQMELPLSARMATPRLSGQAVQTTFQWSFLGMV